ncbi:hypothetical protein GOHSU_13_00140 [Gordonia hirsuta DSM 44140 = NBRC 16056]|uniref:Iron-containing redox enzyme family protein n=1 Tax=Gordonia hirsuta DSM 44140 = NBRC 16056 TaxID=1121927 RepID=L7L9R2_9ACTN|nr:iron-containing redox enzyme family protein [Gordonia hirsuta]GAC56792.1 hypothetical protein GOHSU_13_00140 [Gordonia hirsuta DSM 44140 = NBRC 16056]
MNECRVGPALPYPRGPESAAILTALATDVDPMQLLGRMSSADPLGEDRQLALFVLQELHYRGWAGVDDRREWDPNLIAVRVRYEDELLAAVDEACAGPPASVDAEFAELLKPTDGGGPADWLSTQGTMREFSDYFAVRSLYHLKEADPHAWAIPRLPVAAVAAFVAVESDEYGGGRAERVHQRLFAELLEAAGLQSAYLHYLNVAPAEALVPVTTMTALGLRRARRGAIVGHFAATEVTSSPACARLLAGLERLDAPEPVRHFYREHVEADAVHEQVMRDDVVAGLLTEEPELEADVVAGIRIFLWTEARLGRVLLDAWEQGSTVLAAPLGAAATR